MASEIVLVRIDDRLIHGQVVVGWVKALAATRIIVANDQVADDSLQCCLLEMAAPAPLQVTICPIAEVRQNLTATAAKNERIIILFSSPLDVRRAVELGVQMPQINVGGMRFNQGKKQILKAISVDNEDIQNFRYLLDQGLAITVQMVPTDEKQDIRKFI
jgi:mannose/fructose/sorbose-specific phosphotransferase system IIB component